MRGLSLLCALAFASAWALPASAAAPAQATGSLAHGGTYIVQSDPTVSQAVVQLWFRAPASGYDNASPGIAQLAAAACAVAPLAGGQSLSALASATGGTLDISVFPDVVQVSESGPASSARRIVAAMTAAYFSASPDADALQAARRDEAIVAIERQFSPRLAMLDAVFGQLFTSGPAHVPPVQIAAPSDAQSPTLDQVGAFAARAFRSSNAFLVLSGNVDASVTDAVTDGTAAGGPDAPFDSQVASNPQDVSATGSVDATALAWVGPPIADEKAATAMDFVNDYLFGDVGTVTRALAAAGTTANVSGSFVTLHDPGVMVVTIDGADASAARAQATAAIAAMTKPLDAATFSRALTAFEYHIANQAQTPLQIAGDIGWYAAEGDASYAPAGAAYAHIARTLDADYVARIARTYLQKAPLVVQSARKTSGPT